MFDIDQASWDKGRQMYTQGREVRDVIAEMKREHDAMESEPGTVRLDWRAAQARANGLMCGFIDGGLADLRKIAGGSRGGQRA